MQCCKRSAGQIGALRRDLAPRAGAAGARRDGRSLLNAGRLRGESGSENSHTGTHGGKQSCKNVKKNVLSLRFTFMPESMLRERGDVLPGEGGPSESNSFRAPRVLRAWERGELFFPAKKEQGSNNTVLQQKARALRRGRGCDHPDKDRTRHTERGLFWELGCRFYLLSNKNTSGWINVTVVIIVFLKKRESARLRGNIFVFLEVWRNRWYN